ncbi:phosphatidylcholine-hydrolyzing phospholipase C [Rhizoctonia solani 123E]|uniref:Phosphatidylcholine-hydrolyzing phospholipase C n=1 Tax=Rhizoctonia solani 123E TaxID=1423351 RepID=A0A074RWD3_9AGAM|nr:phosphatidylcholine-hydrolyzing phospholipase C [Rhizoctonia solani 123E]
MSIIVQQQLSGLQPNETLVIGETDIAFGRVVAPVPLRNKPKIKTGWGFEYAEHSFIGDDVNLTLANGLKIPAFDHKFTLDNGLNVTYGQINGLAGDFYGTDKPISDGADAQDQSTRFVAAYNTLAGVSSRQPKEAQDILSVLQTEVAAVNKALADHIDPSIVYNQLPDVTSKLELLTIGRPRHFPSYLGLARINWDHFGQDARTAYNAGHGTALQVAAQGDLERAYTLNAFADHFLEDSFAAGHLRTPRRGLHSSFNPAADLCAKFMHDEDNAIGLSVNNSLGQSWTCYGDKRALDVEDEENLKYCVAAVQASADEVYTAYISKTTPEPSSYKAWTIAPTLESALGPQTLAPLFKYQDNMKDIDRRDVIENRRLHNLTSSWWYASTALKCKTDGWWKYPITIDGPPKIIPWTSFAITTPRIWSTRLYYQSPLGGVLESKHIDGQWTGGITQPALWDAALFTPLAAINWDSGNQIRVYYLSPDYQLREYCCRNGSWFQGELNDMNIQAARNTSIAAFQRILILAISEEGSDEIKEFCHDDGQWCRGTTLPRALSGTSIAAISYEYEGLRFRVYYQGQDLSIREHCFDKKDWSSGEFGYHALVYLLTYGITINPTQVNSAASSPLGELNLVCSLEAALCWTFTG